MGGGFNTSSIFKACAVILRPLLHVVHPVGNPTHSPVLKVCDMLFGVRFRHVKLGVSSAFLKQLYGVLSKLLPLQIDPHRASPQEHLEWGISQQMSFPESLGHHRCSTKPAGGWTLLPAWTLALPFRAASPGTHPKRPTKRKRGCHGASARCKRLGCVLKAPAGNESAGAGEPGELSRPRTEGRAEPDARGQATFPGLWISEWNQPAKGACHLRGSEKVTMSNNQTTEASGRIHSCTLCCERASQDEVRTPLVAFSTC